MNFGYLAVQLISLGGILVWLVLIATALVRLRGLDLPPTAQAVWALVILAIPILGSITFFFVAGKPRG
jgi:hypothetical protein